MPIKFNYILNRLGDRPIINLLNLFGIIYDTMNHYKLTLNNYHCLSN